MRTFEDYCWRDILTPEMELIFSAYHRTRGVASRPALVVIHPQTDFRATAQPGWADMARRLISEARTREIAVVHSVPPSAAPIADLLESSEPISLRPRESAFFFADLGLHLTRAQANGVILCGASTSGALRATAVEAKSSGYKTAIAEDAVADEASLLHKVALFDVAHKYADVMTTDEIIELLPVKGQR
jgi:maleamate amidohydrolase